jgi:hypothetical protein
MTPLTTFTQLRWPNSVVYDKMRNDSQIAALMCERGS